MLKRLAQCMINSRRNHPSFTTSKIFVPDSLISWSKPYPSYRPVEYTHQKILKQPVYADPPNPNEVDWTTRKLLYPCNLKVQDNGRPQNPFGRTGMTGRGCLGKWGPNLACDLMVHYGNSVVAIKRGDSGLWALPGGMWDPEDQTILNGAVREFFEEAAAKMTGNSKNQLEQVFKDSAKEFYRGYVDDFRNTDNAWMETICYDVEYDPTNMPQLQLEAGDDAKEVAWMPLNCHEFTTQFFSGHRDWILAKLK